MNARAPSDLPLAIGGLVLSGLFLPKLFLGAESSLYTEVLTTTVLNYAAALPKLMALLIGAIAAFGCAAGFEAGTVTRRGWALMTVWLATWFVAQAVLGFYQLVLIETAPFPSAADALFMVGYPAMIIAVWLFVRSYIRTGMFGDLRDHGAMAFIAAVPLLMIAVSTLTPVLRSGGDPLEVALNAAYPALDLIAMVPVMVLMRMTLRLRGGAVFWVWALVGMGLAFMVTSDVLFGYFDLLGLGFLEPLLDLTYIASYVFIARGVYQQYRIVADR